MARFYKSDRHADGKLTPVGTTPDGDFVQVAALPLTVGEDGVTRVLLLPSRETKRWVIPEGVAHEGAQAL